jgi:hypothetical protein
MDGDLETPAFAPRPEKTGRGWCILVTWPDGTQEQVCGFGSQAEANDWIKMEAYTWLQLHPKHRRA